jgi:hypothetical protein
MGSVSNPFKAGGIPIKLTTTRQASSRRGKFLTIFLQLLEEQDDRITSEFTPWEVLTRHIQAPEPMSS